MALDFWVTVYSHKLEICLELGSDLERKCKFWELTHPLFFTILRIYAITEVGLGVGIEEKRVWDQTLRSTTIQNKHNKGEIHRSKLTRCSHWVREKIGNCYRFYVRRITNEAINKEHNKLKI